MSKRMIELHTQTACASGRVGSINSRCLPTTPGPRHPHPWEAYGGENGRLPSAGAGFYRCLLSWGRMRVSYLISKDYSARGE